MASQLVPVAALLLSSAFLLLAGGLHGLLLPLRGTIENFPNPVVRALLRVVVFPFGRHYYPAPDALGSKIVRLVLQPGEVRDRLTRDIYISEDPDDATGDAPDGRR